MTIQKFIHLIHKKSGIDEQTIGRLSYTQAIKVCMEQHSIHDPLEYLKLVEQSPNELDRLIEEIIVPETWFFREESAFDAMMTELNSRLPNKETLPIRILSLPSSSGEEAYSIAIKLFESGYSSSMFSIDAIDISQRNIDQASKGIYRPHSFRNNVPESIIEKYFIENSGVYEICQRVKQAVTFTRGNLFDYNTLSQNQYYDIIFCRNLFIYFDASTKATAFKKIDSTLKDEGLLLIGHAESSIIKQQQYEACRTEHSFGFIKRKNKTRSQTSILSTGTFGIRKLAKQFPAINLQARTAPIKTVIPVEQASNNTDTNDDYATASRLADQGELEQALKLTLSICHKDKLADNFSLLGIIYNAQNKTTEAEQAFRKALYLDPDHYEALIHLSLLLDKKGETHTSSLLKKRVVKSNRNNTESHHEE